MASVMASHKAAISAKPASDAGRQMALHHPGREAPPDTESTRPDTDRIAARHKAMNQRGWLVQCLRIASISSEASATSLGLEAFCASKHCDLMSDHADVDVIVAGAGPAGLVAAC